MHIDYSRLYSFASSFLCLASMSKSEARDILNLPAEYTKHELNKNFRKMMLQYHPDRNPLQKEKAEIKAKQFTEAYSLLNKTVKENTSTKYQSNYTPTPEPEQTQSSSRKNHVPKYDHFEVNYAINKNGHMQYNNSNNHFTNIIEAINFIEALMALHNNMIYFALINRKENGSEIFLGDIQYNKDKKEWGVSFANDGSTWDFDNNFDYISWGNRKKQLIKQYIHTDKYI